MTTFFAAADRTAADLVRRLERLPARPEGAFAVRLQMRYPSAAGTRPWLRALVHEPLEPLTATGKAGAYALADTDHVVMCDDLSLELIDRAIVRLNDLLAAEEEARSQTEEGPVSASWYDLSQSEHRDDLARLAADAAAADTLARNTPLRPLSAGDLPGLADLLTAERLAPLLRTQRALLIRSATDIRPLYTEIDVSVGALQRALAPGIDVKARPSLFRCLGERLDKAMLAALTGRGAAIASAPAEPFSLGLDLTTLVTPEFAALAASCDGAPLPALIRVRQGDVLADFDAFAAARDRLHADGFRVVLDGITPFTLDLLDPSGFDVDFVKVRFPAGIPGGCDGSVARLSAAVRRIGGDRLIFADIASEAMVVEALTLGVRRFQGRFIDELVAAMLAKGWL
jgi:hypothetical protein